MAPLHIDPIETNSYAECRAEGFSHAVCVDIFGDPVQGQPPVAIPQPGDSPIRFPVQPIIGFPIVTPPDLVDLPRQDIVRTIGQIFSTIVHIKEGISNIVLDVPWEATLALISPRPFIKNRVIHSIFQEYQAPGWDRSPEMEEGGADEFYYPLTIHSWFDSPSDIDMAPVTLYTLGSKEASMAGPIVLAAPWTASIALRGIAYWWAARSVIGSAQATATIGKGLLGLGLRNKMTVLFLAATGASFVSWLIDRGEPDPDTVAQLVDEVEELAGGAIPGADRTDHNGDALTWLHWDLSSLNGPFITGSYNSSKFIKSIKERAKTASFRGNKPGFRRKARTK